MMSIYPGSNNMQVKGLNLRPSTAKTTLMQRMSAQSAQNSSQRSRPVSGKVMMGRRSRPTSSIINTYTQKFTVKPPKEVELLFPQDEAPHWNKFRPRPPLIPTRASQLRKSFERQPIHQQENTQTKCFTQIFDAKLLSEKLNEQSINSSREEAPQKAPIRRIQSAKPRMETEVRNSKDPLILKLKPKTKRPVSAMPLGSTNRWNYSYTRPVSASISDNDLISEVTPRGKEEKPSFTPFVFGYKAQSYIPGHEPMWSQNNSVVQAWRPFSAKTNQTGSAKSVTMTTRTPRKLLEDDGMSLSELIDFEDVDEEINQSNFSPPRPTKPRISWASPEVSKNSFGVYPSKCPIISSATRKRSDFNQKKEDNVTPTQTNASSSDGSKKSKKYDHPWNALPVEEHECSHGHHKNTHLDVTPEITPETPRQLKVYAIDGRLLHQSCPGIRTEEVVRKEIQELEDLMLGIGTLNGCSIVVQYQAELNRLHNMVNRTMGRVKEIERREEEKRRLAEPADTFGLRKCYKSHDEIMANLREQHELCILELAALTSELEMNTARKHFEDRLADIEADRDGEKEILDGHHDGKDTEKDENDTEHLHLP